MGPQLYRCGNASQDDTAAIAELSLQWGRNFIVAEIDGHQLNFFWVEACFNGAATLSLRKWRVRRGRQETRTCFNGAATLSLRKCATARQNSARITPASMGPQLYRCGNRDKIHVIEMSNYASMGPQLYRCGNGSWLIAPLAPSSSFNGAATLSLRKYFPEGGSRDIPVTLQWGRNFIVAEIGRDDITL